MAEEIEKNHFGRRRAGTRNGKGEGKGVKWTLFPTPKRNEAGLEEEDGGNDGMSVGVAAPGGEREGRSVHGLVVREAPPNDRTTHCAHTHMLFGAGCPADVKR